MSKDVWVRVPLAAAKGAKSNPRVLISRLLIYQFSSDQEDRLVICAQGTWINVPVTAAGTFLPGAVRHIPIMAVKSFIIPEILIC